MNPVTFAHVSDLHLPFEPALFPRQRFSKRQLSAWSWKRRGHLQRPEILDALAADLRSQAPDHILITGDIVNFSLPGEFVQAAQWLEQLAPAARISLVPGNHDALVAVPDGQGLGLWSRWTRLESGWPYVHYQDEIALIGLNSALPTAPLLARGRVGAAQLARLRVILQEQARAGRMRVLLIHHPVAAGAIGWRKALADQAELRALLAEHGAELVLHGHARDARLDTVRGPQGPIPCLCVPSSTAMPSDHDEGARWHVLRLWPQPGVPRAEVRVRRWSVTAQAFVDHLHYELALPRTAARSAP